jgi:hypothetical protein
MSDGSPLRAALVPAVASILGAVVALYGTYLTGWFSYASKDEELRVHLIEVALGILRVDPSERTIAPARGWAIDVIEKNSGVSFSPGDRAELLKKPIQLSIPSVSMPDRLKNLTGLNLQDFDALGYYNSLTPEQKRQLDQLIHRSGQDPSIKP